MANAAQTWWSDSSSSASGRIRAPRHFAGPALGAPRTPRSNPNNGSVKLPLDVSERPADNSRNEPTALSHGKSYRRGAEAPPRSSLLFFVLIGLAVGLFAFGMMHFCLPDPFEKMAAREAAAAQTTPPVTSAVTIAPAPAPEIAPPVAEPTAVTVTTNTPPAPPNRARPAVRRPHVATTKKPSVKTAQLPSNPYGTLN